MSETKLQRALRNLASTCQAAGDDDQPELWADALGQDVAALEAALAGRGGKRRKSPLEEYREARDLAAAREATS